MIAYEELLKSYIDKDDKLMVMTAENRAVLRNIAPLIGDRFIDTGITEQTMIGMSAGLALRGRKPIVHALAAFLTMRAFEFIRTDVGIANLPVKLVGFIPGILSDANGPTHQAIEDVSLMRGIPGMHIFAPANNEELLRGLPSIIESDAPTYIRLNTSEAITTHESIFQIGKAETHFSGSDICVFTYGTMFAEAYEAMQALEQMGHSVKLVNLRMLAPLDTDLMIAAINQAKLVVTIEDHFLTGGLATILAEVIAKNQLCTNLCNIGFDDRWFRPARLSEVLDYEGLSANKLQERILNAYKEKVECLTH